MKNYKDFSELGDRVLAAWVGKGNYAFSTYDRIQSKANLADKVNYHDELEGKWNYIYFCYKRYYE
jgi:hypothetical protein